MKNIGRGKSGEKANAKNGKGSDAPVNKDKRREGSKSPRRRRNKKRNKRNKNKAKEGEGSEKAGGETQPSLAGQKKNRRSTLTGYPGLKTAASMPDAKKESRRQLRKIRSKHSQQMKKSIPRPPPGAQRARDSVDSEIMDTAQRRINQRRASIASDKEKQRRMSDIGVEHDRKSLASAVSAHILHADLPVVVAGSNTETLPDTSGGMTNGERRKANARRASLAVDEEQQRRISDIALEKERMQLAKRVSLEIIDSATSPCRLSSW